VKLAAVCFALSAFAYVITFAAVWGVRHKIQLRVVIHAIAKAVLISGFAVLCSVLVLRYEPYAQKPESIPVPPNTMPSTKPQIVKAPVLYADAERQAEFAERWLVVYREAGPPPTDSAIPVLGYWRGTDYCPARWSP